MTSAAISGIRSLSKNRMRTLLSVDEKSVSETTFRRLCAEWKLHEVVGMKESEFKRKKNFWGDDAERLFKHLGLEDE